VRETQTRRGSGKRSRRCKGAGAGAGAGAVAGAVTDLGWETCVTGACLLIARLMSLAGGGSQQKVAKANFLAQRLAFRRQMQVLEFLGLSGGCEIISKPLTWLGEGRTAKDEGWRTSRCFPRSFQTLAGCFH